MNLDPQTIADMKAKGATVGRSVAETLADVPSNAPSTPAPKPKRHKYGAQRTEVDGHVFASKKEATRYVGLKYLFLSGNIKNLELQPVFELHGPTGVKVGKYTADFRYWCCGAEEIVVEDVKSKATKTTAYRLRKRMAEAEYGITIREV